MPLIPTFLFIESLISLMHLYFFQKSVTIDKYFFIVCLLSVWPNACGTTLSKLFQIIIWD
jgi:hypothetical protein